MCEITSNNNPTNIFNNLCSGLQTFLGFNSASKGYDGSGIVYSDLDRLCDGVMGFLSGVLEGVKNENEVTTYDKNTDNNINTVITKLEDKIGSGRTGLLEAVAEVKAWLEGYEREVERKNSEIKTSMNKISTEIGSLITKIEPMKNSEYSAYSQGVLKDWLDDVKELPTYCSITALNVRRLDDYVEKQLMPSVELVSQAAKNLRDSTIEDLKGLAEAVSKVDREFFDLDEMVNEGLSDKSYGLKGKLEMEKHAVLVTISTGFTNLQKKLEDEFSRIGKKMQTVMDNKTRCFKDINDLLISDTGLLSRFDENYKNHILRKLEFLREEANKFCDALQRNKKELSLLLKRAQGSFRELKNKVIDGSTRKGIVSDWNCLFRELNGLVSGLNGSDGNLKEIAKKAEAYVAQFKKLDDGDSGLKKIVEDWFNSVLKSEAVTQYIDAYVHTNKKNYFKQQDQEELKSKVAEHISKVINPKLNAVVKTVPAVDASKGDNVSTCLTKIRKCLLSLTEQLTGSTQNKDLKTATIVPEIISSISREGNLTQTGRGTDHDKSALHYTVKHIFGGLAAKAKTAATELVWMVDDTKIGQSKKSSIATEIDGATKLVEEFITKFNGSESAAKKIDDALDTVKRSVIALDPILAERQTMDQKIVEIDGELDNLTNFSKDNGTIAIIKTQTDNIMTTLRDTIDEITLTVANGNETLTTEIAASQNTFYEVYDISQKAVSKLQQSLTQTVVDTFRRVEAAVDTFHNTYVTSSNRALREIRKESLKQFVLSKEPTLRNFKTLVTIQLSKIDAIIHDNKNSGLKGLMTKLYGGGHTGQGPQRNMLVDVMSAISQDASVNCANLSLNLREYVQSIFYYITSQTTPSSQLVTDLQARTYALLTHLHENNRTFTFDSGFRSRLHGLTSALSTFNPALFANPHHPQLLDALKAGMHGLVAEMEKAYVNRYCGSKGISWEETKQQKTEPTADATRCAKVFMTCLPMLLNDLSKVKEKCQQGEGWYKLKINSHPKNNLGPFLKSCGYSVASDVPLQDGELQNSSKMKGEHIHTILAKIINISEHEHVPQCRSPKKKHNFNIMDFIGCLNDHLHEYYGVNHYATFTASKHPSTISDMLQWLSGLPFNAVYSDLALNGFEALFEEPKETDAKSIDGGIPVDVEKERSLDAYPTPINVNLLSTSLRDVCHHAEETLISFLGHGHSGGIYACEFNTNSAKLTYPSDPSKCLDLLFEVISRVYNQLFFLFKQCSYTTKLGGWYDCWYGQGVGGSAWNCNTLQCPGQSAEQKADQEHNQKCNQRCDQTAECGVKSPLQSFLEDGLPGFLPHPYSKSNCKPTCTAPGHFGKVCITPMGFNDISGMASRRQQGRHIMDVLREFCGSEHAPLSRLCGLLTCLLTRPPQTLGDMFAFYYNFLNGWHSGNGVREKQREIAYSLAVKDANFENSDNPLEVSSMFKSISHKSKHGDTHVKGDLFSLVACDQSMAKDTYCGRYLQPCGQHIWTVFSEKHAGNYLSWIVYLTETFYDLLKMLYDDCNNKCGQDHSKCNRTSCAVGCPTKSTSESKTSSQNPYHHSKCSTIVTCKSTLPTFCRYGFVFDSPQSLYGEYGDDKKRTCKDFCRALNRVLSDDKKVNDVLAKLKFETIPTFLWNIRSKFFWTTVALWLLSFLYLIHIMVIRLDLLHIKSHLHSPSSHRIAAQSLLAAGRVNKLNRVFYLQP
ncbi:hypothetical protein, conserved [Babesia bigemina]|uniref:C3H1-type domain-containing protein n=1 Tax=Babesia bigemina TaxID=5866 RepID=A0A061BM76_BABBI|nr:hypothetical protein, conserved [Babesia bigemina]CDR71966.1 hypothetical protein, conserved [Babesia bigemina]|eukprot:XP_012770908.1 hypothetical protein, conserved [Babesia bigemina]